MSLYQDAPGQDPYADAYSNAPQQPPAPTSGTLDKDRSPPPPPRGRSRSRSPARYRSPPPRRRSPAPRRPNHAPIVGGVRAPTGQLDSPIAPQAPNPSNVLGVFGLSIRTQERDLDEEFSRFGRVEKVTIVYDQRQSDRSRGFGFIRMATVDDATRCIQELNGVDLNGRRIRVDYSVTDRPHAPTPGEYMGHRSSSYRGDTGRDSYREPYRDTHRDSYRDSYRDSSYRDSYRDSYSRRGGHSDRDKDRDPYGRDSRDWRERRSPAPTRGGGGRYSPPPSPRRRRSYSRTPPRGSGSSPPKPISGAPYDGGHASLPPPPEANGRW